MKIQELAGWMIKEGVDLIHGHLSHHVQDVEIVERKDRTRGLILYGRDDFLDDYAIDQQYRNDLGVLFQLHISVSFLPSKGNTSKLIHLHSLSAYPTRCSNFQVNRLTSEDVDWTWTIGQNSEIILDIYK
ncbi:unnamed protein product [Rotaria sordida]|uniref:Capsule synthesis protein CapA domain-containing protein n=1 Tax=Rotaria sordida TaxID=392033 RepID=A0A819AIY3_9BILA|nr:unnamed protein product [Rotaria sordida]CAF1056618.1 unnamed protein product [Rotaria sordida]CAF3778334.1 unnamed protein product [Rotaria sordida]CAF3889782.1 unnamed protein product [Rotaria sordida]